MPPKTKITAEYNLAILFPEIAKEVSPDWPTTASEISPNSNEKILWKCKICNQNWRMKVWYRTKDKRGCTICSGLKIVAGINDLATLFPDLSEEFDLELNYPVTPQEVNRGSNTVYWWTSKDCGHSWPCAVKGRTRPGKEIGCLVCAGFWIISGINDLASQRPNLIEEWDYDKNELDPSKISINGGGSGHKGSPRAWWLCKKYKHSWDAPISHRSAGSGCPVCANKKVLVGFNDLASQAPHILNFWNYEANDSGPETMPYTSQKRVYLKCSQDHEWSTAARKTLGAHYSCRKCNGTQAEVEIENFLLKLGVRFNRNERMVLPSGRELDFYFPDQAFAIEYNGMYWHSEEGGTKKEYHQEKYNEASSVGVKLLFLWEEDWTDKKKQIKREIGRILTFTVEESYSSEQTSSILEQGSYEDIIFRLNNPTCEVVKITKPRKRVTKTKFTIWSAGNVQYKVGGL